LGKEALVLHRQIRALQPWPGAELHIGEITIKVIEIGNISPANTPPGFISWDKKGVRLSVGDSNEIELLALQKPGKQVQPAGQVMQWWGARGNLDLILGCV
jgi:methionyl-tRNA formyltransferase